MLGYVMQIFVSTFVIQLLLEIIGVTWRQSSKTINFTLSREHHDCEIWFGLLNEHNPHQLKISVNQSAWLYYNVLIEKED